jgi:hypothetical protein
MRERAVFLPTVFQKCGQLLIRRLLKTNFSFTLQNKSLLASLNDAAEDVRRAA